MNILTLIETMSAEELGKIILGERDAFVQEKTQKLLDALMESEIMGFFVDAANATEGNFRNGYYSRTLLNTAFGPLSLRVPRDRIGAFKTKILAPYKRSTDNICEMIQRMYVRGMTEREIVDEISDDFGVTLSRETIRKSVNKVLGDAFAFNSRVIPDCPIVFLDGTYVQVKRRYDSTAKVEKECIMVALGITKEGKKAILGFYFTQNEGAWSWDDVLKDLQSRGLYSPTLFITDGLQGMPEAIHRTYPSARHQLCLVHETRGCQEKRQKDGCQRLQGRLHIERQIRGRKQARHFLIEMGKALSEHGKETEKAGRSFHIHGLPGTALEEHIHLKCNRVLQFETQEGNTEKNTDELRGERHTDDNRMLCRL